MHPDNPVGAVWRAGKKGVFCMSLGDNNAKPLDVVRLYCKLSPLDLHKLFKSPWCCVRQGSFKKAVLERSISAKASLFRAFKLSRQRVADFKSRKNTHCKETGF